MTFDFNGKRAIVCGGSRGIGRAIALGFARAGAAVSICARGAVTLEQTRNEIDAFGNIAHAGCCDLADPAAIGRYITEAAAAIGGCCDSSAAGVSGLRPAPASRYGVRSRTRRESRHSRSQP